LLLLGFTAAILLAPAVAPAGPPGLVAAYAFEETSGSSAADSSGTGNTGAISGAVSSAAGKFGRALSFDGVNDIVSVADSNSLDLTTGMTLEAWVNPQGPDWRTVLLKERPSGLAYALYSNTDTGRPSAEIRTSTPAETRGPAALPSGWSHLATTYDGATLRLYVNGTQVSSQARSGSIEVGTGAVRIGGNFIWGEYYSGLIDELRIYNRALTAGEIQADMNTPIAGPTDTQPPSIPSSLTATIVNGDDVQLAWSAATDNTGVTGYRVYRSVTAGFTPDASTLIATVGAVTSYVDPDRVTGTWHYRVIAIDAATNASAPSAQATATITSDSQPPSAPGNVTATVTGGDDVQLAWTAATDNTGVTGYRVYRSATTGFTPGAGTLIATVSSSATSYLDPDRAPGTWYYRVIAVDAATNASAPSAQALATIGPDSEPPSAPGNLAATVGGDDVHLNWAASTDNVGVTAYKVYESGPPDFTPGGNTSTLLATLGAGSTSYTHANQPVGTSNYRVVALDSAGNVSAPSAEVAGTVAGPNAFPPSRPSNLTATVSGDLVDLRWSPSSDDVGVTSYRVYRSATPNFWPFANGNWVGDAPGTVTSFRDHLNLSNGTFYYKVIALDAINNFSHASTEVQAILEPDVTPPTASVDAPCDGVAPVKEYFDVYFNLWDDRGRMTAQMYVDGTLARDLGEVGSGRVRVEWSTRGRHANGLRSMTVVVQDGAGHETVSAPCLWNLQNPVLTIPISAPIAGAVVRGVVPISTQPHADGQPINGWPLNSVYVTVDGVQVGGGAFPPYQYSWDTTTATNGVHTIQAWMNWMDYGGPMATSTIQVTVDNTVPQPTGLAASVNVDDVQLTWDAAPAGATGFQLHRSQTAGFTPSPTSLIAALNGNVTSHLDANRPAGTWYYRLVAVGAGGSLSAPGAEVAATVEPDAQPPTAPASLAASVTNDDVLLSWAAATDDRAVSWYRIHRSATTGFTPSAATLIGSVDGSLSSAPDNDRPVGTWYYRVIAIDAAGNEGAPSPEASATIVAPPVPTGLVAAYGFNAASGTTAADSSGNGNTGMISGATSSATGKFGRALSFDGINDIVNVADSTSLDLTAGMTLEAWVRPNATGWRTVLLKERPSGLAYALYGSTDNNRPSTEARTSVTFESRGPAALPAATWSHLAATYDGATLRLYVNGVQVSSVPRSGVSSLEVGTGALRIGGNTVWGEYFGGLIDEVRIYNRALSAAEIATDRDTPVGA
jgi:hypothetical protein